MLGCKAAAGIPVLEISKEAQVSRTYIYHLKESVQNYIEDLDKTKEPVLSINIDKGFIKRMVLSLSLDCHASMEGIRRMRSSRGDVPVLTGIDAESTYVSLLAEADDRSADTWQLFMEDCKERGLALDVTISDAGTGLNAGIPKAFPDIPVQPDIFHELRPVGAELARLERKAEKLISDEASLEKRACGKRPQKKTLERLEQIHEKVDAAIQGYELLRILFC